MARSGKRETSLVSPLGDTPFDSAVHATCIAMQDRGLLVLGAAGSGKSALALQLIALGAKLVADDRVLLSDEDGGITATAPEPIAGLIEARGIGVLNAPVCKRAPIRLVVSMDHVETERIPPFRTCQIGPYTVPLVHKSDNGHFPAAVALYLLHGRKE